MCATLDRADARLRQTGARGDSTCVKRRFAMALAKDLTASIRHIFLHQRPHVSIMTPRRWLGWSVRQMKAAIDAGEIETNVTPLATWVWREELVAKALELWPIDVIEEALGEEAERVLPAALRTQLLRARVPRYQVAMLQHMAEQKSTSVSAVLRRELEDVACAHADELSRAIPGFAAALTWPLGESIRQVC